MRAERTATRTTHPSRLHQWEYIHTARRRNSPRQLSRRALHSARGSDNSTPELSIERRARGIARSPAGRHGALTRRQSPNEVRPLELIEGSLCNTQVCGAAQLAGAQKSPIDSTVSRGTAELRRIQAETSASIRAARPEAIDASSQILTSRASGRCPSRRPARRFE